MLLKERLRRRHELERGHLVALVLKARHNVAHQATLDTIGLHRNKSPATPSAIAPMALEKLTVRRPFLRKCKVLLLLDSFVPDVLERGFSEWRIFFLPR